MNESGKDGFRIRRVRRLTDEWLKKRERFERAHSSVFAFIAGVGLIMFWYGIWEGLKLIPVLGKPLVSIGVGALIMLAGGSYAYQFIGDKAKELRQELQDVSDDVDRVVDAVDDLAKVKTKG